MSSSRWWLATVFLAPGCAPTASGPWDQGAVLEAGVTEHGDPVRGADLLLNGDYMTCGIPFALWEGGGGAIAGAFGGDLDAPRIADRPGDNADVPYNITVFDSPDGTRVMNTNCLGCHGAMADGELVLGLGNPNADFTSDPSASAEAITAETLALLGLTEPEIAQYLKMSTRAAAVADLGVMRTVGQNPAEMLAVALMLHHDVDTLAWSEEPLSELEILDADGQPIPDGILTSDPPPWWRAKKKNALFYNGMARGDQRGTMALATSVCVDSVDRAMEVDEQFKDIHAFVLSLSAPVYPRAIDADLADKGGLIFEDECAGCHGTYAEDPQDDAADTYPNLLIPLDLIGTDPAVANAGIVHAPGLVDWYNSSFYGAITKMVPDDPFPGYMPPPLDGIWATAPFLHNGSVPTIELVLDSRRRPQKWKRVDYDSTNLDTEALGWPWEAVTEDPETLPHEDAKHVYDSRHWSQSNAGHTFGDHLSDGDRRAVIEYLKTL